MSALMSRAHKSKTIEVILTRRGLWLDRARYSGAAVALVVLGVALAPVVGR